MKKLLFLCAIPALVLVAGCSKDDTPACETNNTGKFKMINNNSSNRWYYVDGVQKGTVYANSSATIDLSVGSHKIETTAVGAAQGSTQGCLYSSVSITQCTTKEETCSN
jgi:hypothetical protein